MDNRKDEFRKPVSSKVQDEINKLMQDHKADIERTSKLTSDEIKALHDNFEKLSRSYLTQAANASKAEDKELNVQKAKAYKALQKQLADEVEKVKVQKAAEVLKKTVSEPPTKYTEIDSGKVKEKLAQVQPKQLPGYGPIDLTQAQKDKASGKPGPAPTATNSRYGDIKLSTEQKEALKKTGKFPEPKKGEPIDRYTAIPPVPKKPQQ